MAPARKEKNRDHRRGGHRRYHHRRGPDPRMQLLSRSPTRIAGADGNGGDFGNILKNRYNVFRQ